ncbi:hypothetical protein Hypma_013673 [Hypsizygus marmoreus]|uniref:Transmembrane protein n=1 Tax=Hypsizygus marmoreus TaxID=39966 RepID=A0A369JFI0_HYPMA|nr:hypothetical protein Hypma_013673 [Hypsizygus marmoreus]
MACTTIFECGEDTLLQALGTHTKMKRETPKIGGSFGGFIAVIVCLVLVIVVSCTAVFFLLRDQKAFDEEQARRRKRSRYHHSGSETQIPSYEGTSTRQMWSARLLSFLRRGNTQNNTHSRGASRIRMKRGGLHGWVQTGSGDGWDSDASVERRARAVPTVVEEVHTPSPPSVYTPPRFAPTPVSRSISDSASSVRFDLHAIRGLPYPDRHGSPQSTLPNIQSQLSISSYSPAPSPVPIRTLSPEPIPEAMTLEDDTRHYVTPSGAVMRTFPGGTKFIEAL